MRGILLSFCVLTAAAPTRAAVETFVETFNGDGPYQSITNDLVGFDNAGWEVYSDDGFAAGGFYIQNDGAYEQPETDILERTLAGMGSFRTRVELNDLDLGEYNEEEHFGSIGKIDVNQRLHEGPGNTIYMSVLESNSVEPEWIFSVYSSRNQIVTAVPRGSRVAMEMAFDAVGSEVTFTYDNDTSDATGPMSFGPLAYEGSVQDTQLMTIIATSTGAGKFDGILDFLSVTSISDVVGDFDGNGILDAADIDQLSEQVRSNTNDSLYDLNTDAVVNDLDRQFWVHELKSTYFGDADLNGSFDSTDLVQVLASGEYEDDVELNSTWLTGDWDGDGDFTSGDLVTALADGGYETAAAAVPEPSGIMLAIGLLALATARRH